MSLMINGIDAMKGVDGTRGLTVCSQRDGSNQLLILMSDTGVGLPRSPAGWLWAGADFDTDAMFRFALPTITEAHS